VRPKEQTEGPIYSSTC